MLATSSRGVPARPCDDAGTVAARDREHHSPPHQAPCRCDGTFRCLLSNFSCVCSVFCLHPFALLDIQVFMPPRSRMSGSAPGRTSCFRLSAPFLRPLTFAVVYCRCPSLGLSYYTRHRNVRIRCPAHQSVSCSQSSPSSVLPFLGTYLLPCSLRFGCTWWLLTVFHRSLHPP